MGRQKWFRSKSFFVMLLDVVGGALQYTARAIARKYNNRNKKQKGGAEAKK